MRAAADHRAIRPSGYLPTLDGWRAIAILGVMICHASDGLFQTGGIHPNSLLRTIAGHGALGVDIFFGISGFLICSCLLAEHRQNGAISMKRFYVRRFFRILPPYMMYLAGLAILAVLGFVTVSPSAWWSCLLFFRNYLPDESGGTFYTGHFWSLAVEEHFYLIWPGLLVLAGITRARRMVVGLAGMVAVWRAWEFRHQWMVHLIPALSNCRWDWRTDVRLDGLLWGCWMALLVKDAEWRERLRRWLSPGVCLGLVAAFIACVYYKPPFAWTWQSILIVLILAGTVLRPQAFTSLILETPPMRWVGRMSYSLYLWNSLFFPGMGYPRPLPLGILQTFPMDVFLVFAFASLSHYLVERPLIRLGHSLAASTSSKPRESPTEGQLTARAA
jgi:peptidoglycan/LPS O-acetylase OafA/YrhL